MLLARYAPIGSNRFEKLSKNSVKFEKVINWLPAQLFGIWTIFIAGMSAGKAQIDRYYFWDWSDWLTGIIGVIVITFIFKPLKDKLKVKEIDEINWMINSRGYIFYLIFGIVLFLSGWFFVNSSSFQNISSYIICYLAYFLSVMLVYMIKVDNNLIYDLKAKVIHIIIAISFLIGCIFIGFISDDPVISTASIVSLPFYIVLLFGTHVRHLQRAKFYPIFIFAMFVSSREAWLLIPLLLLFFVLRSYNYLRHQKVYPTFGVSDDRD